MTTTHCKRIVNWPGHSGSPLRLTARLAAATALLGVAALDLYCGWYWVTDQGGGCDPATDAKLANIGAAMIGVSALVILSAILGRLRVGGAFALPACVLLVYGMGTAISCLS